MAHGTTGRVVVEWAPVKGATHYRVFRGIAGVWTSDPIATVWRLRFVDYSVRQGALHSYKVAPVNRGGVGPQSGDASATPIAPPAEVTATGGERQVTVKWAASTGATGYIVYRGLHWEHLQPVAKNINATMFVDTGLTNGKRYVYRIRALALSSESRLSPAAAAKPLGAPPTVAPVNLQATSGNAFIQLSWNAVTGATGYSVFRSTNGGPFGPTPLTTATNPTFKNTGLTNGVAYSYRVAARNGAGDGPLSAAVTATPNAPPPAPTNLSATGGNAMVTLSWTAVTGTTTYRVYRGTTANGQAAAPLATDLTAAAFVDSGVTNGIAYFYKVTAVAGSGESARSTEATATPTAPPAPVDQTTLSAFRLLRQSTWGPKPGDVDRVKAMGAGAFIDEQMGAPTSTYPNTLYDQSVEHVQEHFMGLAINGPDQLRQRVAWALHKIWVVSAVELNKPRAIVPYYRIMTDGAFGNYRNLMRAVTLNPAMGRYLNMLNNRAQAVTGSAPNENYARELLQLFTLGLYKLNPDGTPVLEDGAPAPSYTEADVKALARIFTGWTFGDGDQNTIPGGSGSENYTVPMEAVNASRRYHDVTQKTFLGEDFPANVGTVAELDHALQVIFDHPNVGPFVSRQLIQQLVTSNPSPQYVADIATVFGAPGSPSRGDLAAVVRAILTHPEAAATTPTSGKLSEPVLYALSMVRGLNATVTDHPFLSDLTAEMGQRVFFPGSVFSYFSPGYRVRGTGTPPLGGPEFQGLTSVTVLERVNFAGRLLGNHFGADVAVDYTPFTTRAVDVPALVDYVNLLFMGGRMSAEQRNEIIAAVRVTPATNTLERARTALYLTIVAAQAQVDN